MNCRVFFGATVAMLFLAVDSAPTALASTSKSEIVESACGNFISMSMLREIDFVTFFPTEEQAIEAAAEIDETIFNVLVRTSAEGSDWVLRAVYRELPSAEAHARQVDVMRQVANKNGSQNHTSGCASHYFRP